MKTVAIASQKGGTGKTTLAVHLAAAATLAGLHAAVIDVEEDVEAACLTTDDLRRLARPIVTPRGGRALRIEELCPPPAGSNRE
jgi:chromosome partitioning protein